MHVFIGGACAGKHAAVRARFPAAGWWRLDEGCALDAWRSWREDAPALVITGWAGWLDAALATGDDDALRARLAAELDALCEMERVSGPELVLILPEMGRGIVPVDAAARRLRDLVGWFAQDAAARAETLWYVRHGLTKRLK